MQRSRTTLKAWFETGDFPTQSQFWDLIDSVLNLTDDAISQAQIDGLIDALAAKADQAAITSLQNQINTLAAPDSKTYTNDASYALADGKMIDKIVVLPTVDITLKIGSTEGGSEYLDSLPIVASSAAVINTGIYAKGASTIYFTGITDSTTIKFYLK